MSALINLVGHRTSRRGCDLMLGFLKNIFNKPIEKLLQQKQACRWCNALSQISKLGLCKKCAAVVEIGIHESLRIINDSIQIIDTSKNPSTVLSRKNLIATHISKLKKYRLVGISVSIPQRALDIVTQQQKHENTEQTFKIDPRYIHEGNSIKRADGKPISDKEIPYVRRLSWKIEQEIERQHKAGLRDVLKDHEFSKDERTFFTSLVLSLKENELNPSLLRLTRLSSEAINVDYVSECYVGKIHLSPKSAPDRYAVIRNGAKRALRVLNTEAEAQSYMQQKGADRIELRPGCVGGIYMQYMKDLYTAKELRNPTLQECIDAIPKWIKYIKYCQQEPQSTVK